jgi:acyl-coenzyme A synthetase/AMP-(fatty) acid ligase
MKPLLFLEQFKTKDAWTTLDILDDDGIALSSDFLWNLKSQLVASLKQYSTVETIIIVSEKRSFLFCAMIACFLCQKKVVFPHTDAHGILAELISQESAALLTDVAHLATLSDAVKFTYEIYEEIHEESPHHDLTDGHICFYTSGSSGVPQKILKEFHYLFAEIKALYVTWGAGMRDDTVFLSTVQPHHLYGNLFSFLWPILTQSCVYDKTIHFWEDIENIVGHDTTAPIALISSPAHLNRIPEHLSTFQGSFHLFSSGGALTEKAYSEVQRQFLNYRIHEIYGSTESGGIGYRSSLNGPIKAFEDVVMKNVNQEFYELTSPYFKGVLIMNDVVDMQPDGTFYLLGRSDRIVKIEGKRVSLTDLENRLRHNKLISECFVVRLENDQRDTLVVVAVLTDHGEIFLSTHKKFHLIQQLKKNLRDFYDAVLIPRRWVFVDQIPQNAQGKFLKSELDLYFKGDQHE